MNFETRFDVIVVGGGHAGTEAALAAARMGAKTLLLTHNIETLGQMSCNPSIGGIGKGHLVKEVDALGGAMAIATDEAGIQFRMLNSQQGAGGPGDARAGRPAAVQAGDPLAAGEAAEPDAVPAGGRRPDPRRRRRRRPRHRRRHPARLRFEARTVVLTTGTFLSGLIHVGLANYEAGRAGDPPAITLGRRLRELKLPAGRLKTGTPPRLDGRTIDFSVLAVQPGDDPAPVL